MNTNKNNAADITIVPRVRDSLTRDGEGKENQTNNGATVQDDFDDGNNMDGVSKTEHLSRIFGNPTHQRKKQFRHKRLPSGRTVHGLRLRVAGLRLRIRRLNRLGLRVHRLNRLGLRVHRLGLNRLRLGLNRLRLRIGRLRLRRLRIRIGVHYKDKNDGLNDGLDNRGIDTIIEF